MGREELVDKILTENFLLGQDVQRLPGKLRQALMLEDPMPERQTKPLFLLGDDLLRQEIPQSFFEEPAQLRALELVLRGESEGEVQKIVVEEGECNVDASESGCADDLGEVIVCKGEAPVEAEHSIYKCVSIDLLPYTALKLERRLGINTLKK